MRDHSDFSQPNLADRRPAAGSLPPAAVRAGDAAHDGAAPLRLRAGAHQDEGAGGTSAAQGRQDEGEGIGHRAEQNCWPTLPQPLAAGFREAARGSGQHSPALDQLHPRLLPGCAPHLHGLLRVWSRNREDAGGQHPLSGRLQVPRGRIYTRIRYATSRWGSSSRT